MNMPHLIVLHSGSNEFYINAEHISAIFPTIVRRDRRELHGSKLILVTHASRFIVEESPAKIIELVEQSGKERGFSRDKHNSSFENECVSPEENEKPFTM